MCAVDYEKYIWRDKAIQNLDFLFLKELIAPFNPLYIKPSSVSVLVILEL